MRTIDQLALRKYVRAREDFQKMRKAMDNRLGRKADGTDQNLKADPLGLREFDPIDLENFDRIAKNARKEEDEIEKMLNDALKKFPIYTQWLSNIKGIAANIAGHLLSEFDIEEATTVSKMYQYAGLNPGLIQGKIRIPVDKFHLDMGIILETLKEKGSATEYIVLTNTLIRGDKPRPGFILPYNKRLRTVLIGILAEQFIKYKKTCQPCRERKKAGLEGSAENCTCERSPYAIKYYYPYKARLEQEHSPIQSLGNKDDGKAWKDVSKGHRDFAAKRYMIKMFLIDFYVAWRTIEGLPVRKPYAEEYLGKVHG